MIDFKNYERVTNSNDYNNICYEVSCNFDCKNCYLGKRSIRLADLEDMIEQGKLVEKIEPKTTLTNREYLNNLSNEELAITMLFKVNELHRNNLNVNDVFVITDKKITDFVNWLEQEHKE